MYPILTKIGVVIAGFSLSVASFFTGVASHFASPNLGAVQNFNPVQAAPAFLSGAGITSNATSVNLTAFTTRQGSPITNANIGSIGFATIDPGTVKEENISFSSITQNVNGSAQLTGVIRGLLPVYPYSASSTLSVAHSGGATLILSNSAPFYAQFNIAANTSTITGNWTFASSAVPTFSSAPTFSNALQIVDKAYVDSSTVSGAANADFATKGIVQIATTSEMIAGTTLGSTGAFLVPSNKFVSPTSSVGRILPLTQSDGTLSSGFIDQKATTSYNFLGQTILASTTINGSSTFSLTSVPSFGVLLGGAGSTTRSVAPSSTGNVLTASGTTWISKPQIGFSAPVSTSTLTNCSTTPTTDGILVGQVSYAGGGGGTTPVDMGVTCTSNGLTVRNEGRSISGPDIMSCTVPVLKNTPYSVTTSSAASAGATAVTISCLFYPFQ